MSLVFENVEGNIVSIKATGRLTDDDYEAFVPRMESLIERWGRLRMLFDLDDFEGWDLASAWEELKFEARHRKDLKRVAVVGEKKWERWTTKLSKVFTGTDVRFFERAQEDEARTWITAGW